MSLHNEKRNNRFIDVFIFFRQGWYWIINSCDLKPGDVKAISYCGRNVVLFRGKNGKPYVLDAYCAHMGAHLGIGGKVRFNNCIECPFHGWAFDGETGQCVLSTGESKTYRKADCFEYLDIERCIPKEDLQNAEKVYLTKTNEQQDVRLKNYLCREINGSILVWYHSDDKLRLKPLFEPFDIADEIKVNKMEGKKNILRSH